MHSTTTRWVLLALPMALLLHGCQTTGGFIGTASFSGLDSRPDEVCDSQDPVVHEGCTAERRQSLAFAPLGNDVTDLVFLDIRGSGRCGQLQIDFGDGSPIETYLDKQINGSLQLTHHYTGWPGKKVARVIAAQNCTGSRTVEVTVGFKPDGRDFFILGFVPNGSVCNPVPNVPPLRAGTTVRITTDGSAIRYGLPVFNASGDLTIAAAGPDFAFSTLRPYSLVYRIGTQAIQGEAGPVIFRVAQTGPLEVCVNDNPSYLTDNRGSMRIDIAVNEGSATTP